ncbi:hypothetical protein HH303_13375 [Rhodospirillaceae bacterium KN72]|uniref:SIR2-like domain-containing protein n=1 Tax=Pacificispira spongiicola TaxID=2729598 RepID=A0A7Y0E1H1_9PROT|nr:SIR2 family protein [Pacificispira spongiicola]NMM45479.1 hypothetical protein [Pacificispira spongiicola]
MGGLKELCQEDRDELISAVYGRRYFFWIGSGFSSNFGYPSWGAVLKNTKKNIGYDGQLPDNYLYAAEILHSYFESTEQGDEIAFNQAIINALDESYEEEVDPKWVHLFKKFASGTVVTTNWDDVLEKVFDFLTSVVVRGDKKLKISDDKNILKIHGDRKKPESIVVTQSQYTKFQREDTYLKSKIFTMFAEKVPIFLGYSLADPNVYYIYDEVVSHMGNDRPPAFMVVHPDKDPEKDKEKFEQFQHLFAKKNICLIKADIGTFLKELDSYREKFANRVEAYDEDYASVMDRLNPLIEQAVAGDLAKKTDILEFASDEARRIAIKALVRLIDNPEIFKKKGGTLNNPGGTISDKQAHSLFQSIIKIGNKIEGESVDSKDRKIIGRVIYDTCVNNPFLWDFNRAEIPFTDLMSFHIHETDEYYEKRLDLIKELLDFGGKKPILGKCWAIYDEFSKRIDWLRPNEVSGLIDRVEADFDDGDGYIESSKWWLKKLMGSGTLTKLQSGKVKKILS